MRKYLKHLFIYAAAQFIILIRALAFIVISWAVFTAIIYAVRFFIAL